MNVDDVVRIAQRVHDLERMNFGSSSSREQRNEQWARIIGIVHWGHPTYNSTPDTQWHIKNAGGGRAQSDDVVVSLPSRQFWDCIPGSGADGYRFDAHSDGTALPSVQEVYPPPKPVGYVEGGAPNPTPPPTPTPQPTPEVIAALNQLKLQVEQLISVINAQPTRECRFVAQECPTPTPHESEPGLKASIDALNDKLDRGLEGEAKGGWPVGTIKLSARLRPSKA